jgi:hypothetical protein
MQSPSLSSSWSRQTALFPVYVCCSLILTSEIVKGFYKKKKMPRIQDVVEFLVWLIAGLYTKKYLLTADYVLT